MSPNVSKCLQKSPKCLQNVSKLSPNVSIETFFPYRLHQSEIPNALPVVANPALIMNKTYVFLPIVLADLYLNASN